MTTPIYDVQPGQLVLVRLDSRASVAALDDKTATQAAERLHNASSIYLALVAAIGSDFVAMHNGSIACSVELLLVGDGRPVECPSAAAPLALLPGFFVHTACAVSAYVSNIHDGVEYTTVPLLSPAELHAIVAQAYLDQQAAQCTSWMSQIAEADETASPLASSIFSGFEPESAASSRSSQTHLSYYGEGYGTSPFDAKLATIRRNSIDADAAHLERTLKLNAAPLAFVELTAGLDAYAGPLGVPADIRSAYLQLKEIWREWQERMVTELYAKRPRTARWIQSVSRERLDVQDDDARLAPHLLDDADVLPEDAIDERYAQRAVVAGCETVRIVDTDDRLTRAWEMCESPQMSHVSEPCESTANLLPRTCCFESTPSRSRSPSSFWRILAGLVQALRSIGRIKLDYDVPRRGCRKMSADWQEVSMGRSATLVRIRSPVL
ncbi:hypothetical protein AURDEDRAFT_153945 [Auricularia subglabra TFB-10046 SS5]|uniref:Uncharacterized protein n=1 Tax=Auricularia subglabra (strain TFB-10046 / SS5) TaxID=717982 RepID=J0DBS9_AURST|nr:hypothetical protein AURDEDRAFT_153945 [Auricularia subglabra TFB-10046 SS5]